MPNYSKKYKGTVSKPSLGYDNIIWENARIAYNKAAAAAKLLAEEEHLSIYNARIEQLEREYDGGESGAHEGNFSDSHPMPVINKYWLEDKMDKAGQLGVRTDFVDTYGLIEYPHVFMPQIITMLARMTLKRNENGLISGLQFRNDNFTTPTLKGLYWFLMLDARSSYLKTQYKGTNKEYCALVPTIMYAHKLVHGVKYSEWDPREISYVVNGQLAEAMCYEHEPFTADQLLYERKEGLTIRSGNNEGSQWSPVWKHRLSGPQLKEGILKDAPYLAQVMLTQIWCAHPENRSAYMILDPMNWDRVPPALISKDVITPMPKRSAIADGTDTAEGWGDWNA